MISVRGIVERGFAIRGIAQRGIAGNGMVAWNPLRLSPLQWLFNSSLTDKTLPAYDANRVDSNCVVLSGSEVCGFGITAHTQNPHICSAFIPANTSVGLRQILVGRRSSVMTLSEIEWSLRLGTCLLYTSDAADE